ncbi:MAG TPA: FkbM family methyltransferase [Acidimicrobiales bacterium]
MDGTYEPELLARLASLLDSGDGFLDLGANAGFVSFMVKTMVGSGRVIAVEPLPDNIAMIGRIQAINPDLPVELIEGAVGAERGDISLGVAANTANSRIDGAAWSLEKPLVDEVVVRSYPLDDLIAEARPAVVKIDIEGAEELVLAASQGPEGWGIRPALIIEYHGPVNRAYCVARLEAWGYEVAVEPSVDQPEDSGLVVASTRSVGEQA